MHPLRLSWVLWHVKKSKEETSTDKNYQFSITICQLYIVPLHSKVTITEWLYKNILVC